MKRLLMGVVLMVMVNVNAAAQTSAQVEALMQDTGWSEAQALAWGQRYYGWGTEVDKVVPPPQCETVGTATVCDVSECVGMDIYAEGSKALACIQWVQARRAPEPPPVYTFRVGALYMGAYPSFRMRVLGITLDSQGREVVTCEWLAGGPTGVFAMVNVPGQVANGMHPAFWQLAKEQR